MDFGIPEEGWGYSRVYTYDAKDQEYVLGHSRTITYQGWYCPLCKKILSEKTELQYLRLPQFARDYYTDGYECIHCHFYLAIRINSVNWEGFDEKLNHTLGLLEKKGMQKKIPADSLYESKSESDDEQFRQTPADLDNWEPGPDRLYEDKMYLSNLRDPERKRLSTLPQQDQPPIVHSQSQRDLQWKPSKKDHSRISDEAVENNETPS